MPQKEPKHIEELLSEADALIQRIQSDAIRDMEETQRLEIEKRAQHLEKIKSKVLAKFGDPHIDTGTEGMHEAIQDIVKAIEGLRKYLF